MANAKSTANGKSARVPELLREPLLAAQARVELLEEEAKRLLEDLMARGRASKRDLEQMLHRLSKQDWSIPEVKHRVEKLQAQGKERAAELRGKAEAFRVEALERVMDLQSKAVQFLGAASRDQVDELSRELDRLARRLDRTEKSKRPRKAKPSEV
jgi:polyhydroxyalkanoate synthesis regulator phasin